MLFALSVSMPHAALWVVQPRPTIMTSWSVGVSMPHAALWVVQQRRSSAANTSHLRFNAARGFVGGATTIPLTNLLFLVCFNAARGFVGGATST